MTLITDGIQVSYWNGRRWVALDSTEEAQVLQELREGKIVSRVHPSGMKQFERDIKIQTEG